MGDLSNYSHDELAMMLFATAVLGFMVGALVFIIKNTISAAPEPKQIMSDTETMLEAIEAFRLRQIDKILAERVNSDAKIKRAQEITTAVADFRAAVKH